MNDQSLPPATDPKSAIIERFKLCLIERAQLQRTPDSMAHDVPIFGEGLGLDSVDALLMALIIETEFGVAVSDDDIFAFVSLNDIADFILSRGPEGLSPGAAAAVPAG